MTCGSSYKNKGVQELLDAIVEYMPSPLDKKAISGVNPKTDEEETREPSDDAPFAALAFSCIPQLVIGAYVVKWIPLFATRATFSRVRM